MLFLSLPLLILTLIAQAKVPVYGPCVLSHNHLKPSTKEFVSDCDAFGYCASNGTCLPRQCRKDLYVLASIRNSTFGIPPMCQPGSYCPDDASGCLPLVTLGGACELNRDDECDQTLPPPHGADKGGEQGRVICLLGSCTPAIAHIGQSCMIENTTYAGYDSSGTGFNLQIVRDDCIPQQGFCNATSATCQDLKVSEEPCEEDRECTSANCVQGVCGQPVNEETRIQSWIYVLVAFGMAGAMAGVLAGLIWLHKKNEEANQSRMEEYYRQQAIYQLYRASSVNSQGSIWKK
ncbi:hypothetical protein BD324DRAFT_631714 [Kockovaella imperatae]|uniref:Dickkopf N-terminal cysteine-rich domain-containing protein n=1 Tax=Kockovaella imperatae TaxID=4999 RepID=A0A1Y1UE50_9TREE|nr:hypothetical protein BD324DRAFT_631714 [Kockovaella imperatae]ORX35794.1 hypothetical protein BD324DRAFT_631714 [Kockovaella imperatae]